MEGEPGVNHAFKQLVHQLPEPDDSKSKPDQAAPEAKKQKMVMCYVTECLRGSAEADYSTSLKVHSGVLVAIASWLQNADLTCCYDMTAQAAYAKLAVRLWQAADWPDRRLPAVQRAMKVSLRGEIMRT